MAFLKAWAAALAGLAAATAGPAAAQKSAYDPSAPPADPALKAQAEQLAQKVWAGALRSCGRYALESIDGRVMVELEEPRFTLAAMRLPDAAEESGYQFRGVALASAKRWRWARQGGGAPRWSAWELGSPTVIRDDNLTLDRGNTAIDDVVLRFDVVKKDGAWSANQPISSLNYAIKPVDLQKVSLASATPSCKQAGAS